MTDQVIIEKDIFRCEVYVFHNFNSLPSASLLQAFVSLDHYFLCHCRCRNIATGGNRFRADVKLLGHL